MEFSISKKNLLECLNHFQSVVEKRNTIPILSNIKVIVDEKNGLEIAATDLALEISETLSANIVKSGGITIPSQLFYDIIRKAPDSSNIELRKDEKKDYENSEELLDLAPSRENKFFKVPKIISE